MNDVHHAPGSFRKQIWVRSPERCLETEHHEDARDYGGQTRHSRTVVKHLVIDRILRGLGHLRPVPTDHMTQLGHSGLDVGPVHPHRPEILEECGMNHVVGDHQRQDYAGDPVDRDPRELDPHDREERCDQQHEHRHRHTPVEHTFRHGMAKNLGWEPGDAGPSTRTRRLSGCEPLSPHGMGAGECQARDHRSPHEVPGDSNQNLLAPGVGRPSPEFHVKPPIHGRPDGPNSAVAVLCNRCAAAAARPESQLHRPRDPAPLKELGPGRSSRSPGGA